MMVKYRLKNQYFSSEKMVDVMNVAGKLRWATSEGDQDTLPDAEVLGFRSNFPCKVSVDTDSGAAHFPLVTFAETEDDVVYLSGPNLLERKEGEIVRIRKHAL